MNKVCLLLTVLLISVKGFSQAGDASSAISYGGHTYANAYDEDAKLAVWSQRIINNQKTVDTIAQQRYDKYVTNLMYDNSVKELAKTVRSRNRITDASAEVKSWLTDYYTLQNAISGTVINNLTDRHFMYILNNRVMMTINEGMTYIEGWDLDQTLFNVKNAVIEASAYVRNASTDNYALRAAFSTVSENPRYSECRYNITIDDSMFARVGNPSDIEIYMVDQLHYNIAKTRYKTDIAKGVIPTNYAGRKKESAFLQDYLKASMNIAKETMMYTISLGSHVGEKPNNSFTSLSQVPDWYIYVFVKGKLYYVNNMPKGAMGETLNIFIPNKM